MEIIKKNRNKSSIFFIQISVFLSFYLCEFNTKMNSNRIQIDYDVANKAFNQFRLIKLDNLGKDGKN